MARILALFSRTPYPLTDGGRIRRYNTAKILNQEHTVDLLIIDEKNKEKKQITPLIEEFHGVTLFSYPPSRFFLNTIPGILSHQPLQIFYFSFKDVHHWLETHKERYDLFYCNHIRTASYVRSVQKPKVVDLIDAASRKYYRGKKNVKGKWRLIYPIESRRMIQYERQIVQEFDHAFITSPFDRKFLQSKNLPLSSLSIIPNGVKNHLLQYPESHMEMMNNEKNWLVFLGSMKSPANEDGVLYFVNKIFPKIRAKHPEMKFLIVGKQPSWKVQRLSKEPGVHVTGFVKEPAAYLAQACVVVAPLRFGTGIQNKVLEAMALGKPVVTTKIGREGISAIDNKHLRVANTPKAFATAVNSLLENSTERERMGDNARQLIKENYTWDAIRPKILKPINRLLK